MRDETEGKKRGGEGEAHVTTALQTSHGFGWNVTLMATCEERTWYPAYSGIVLHDVIVPYYGFLKHAGIVVRWKSLEVTQTTLKSRTILQMLQQCFLRFAVSPQYALYFPAVPCTWYAVFFDTHAEDAF